MGISPTVLKGPLVGQRCAQWCAMDRFTPEIVQIISFTQWVAGVNLRSCPGCINMIGSFALPNAVV